MLPDAVQYECESLSGSTLNTSIPSAACASTRSVTPNKQSPVTLMQRMLALRKMAKFVV